MSDHSLLNALRLSFSSQSPPGFYGRWFCSPPIRRFPPPPLASFPPLETEAKLEALSAFPLGFLGFPFPPDFRQHLLLIQMSQVTTLPYCVFAALFRVSAGGFFSFFLFLPRFCEGSEQLQACYASPMMRSTRLTLSLQSSFLPLLFLPVPRDVSQPSRDERADL